MDTADDLCPIVTNTRVSTPTRGVKLRTSLDVNAFG
jgi:hypothetical protein